MRESRFIERRCGTVGFVVCICIKYLDFRGVPLYLCLCFGGKRIYAAFVCAVI